MDNLLAIDEPINSLVISTVETTQSNLQKIVDAYKVLNIGTFKTIDEIFKLAKAPEQILKNKIIDLQSDSLKFNGLILNRSKLLELVELPKEFKNFIVFLERAVTVIDDDVSICKQKAHLNVLSFDIINDIVVPTNGLLEKMERAGKFYAQNPDQLIMFKKIKNIIKLMDELRTVKGAMMYGQRHLNIDPFIMVDPHTMELKPNHIMIMERIK